MTPLRFLLLAAFIFGLSGCAQLPERDGAKAGPFFTPTNVKSTVTQLPANIRRVLLLPVSAEGLAIPEDNLNRIDAAFLTELNRVARFEIVTLTRDELAHVTGARQLNSTAPLPPGFIDRLFNIYNQYAADAVVFVDLTSYSAYPPLTLGVRARLAPIRQTEILWAADVLYSAADISVANSARRYSLSLGKSSGPTDLSHTILQNPTRFASYAAAATFATLPPRFTPEPTPSK
ncbi:MAG: hypothetical protein QM760_08290 [Nibricoccus sp.]